MSTKHTPGPWRMSDCGKWSVSHDGYGATSYIGVKDQTGAVVAIAVAHDPEPFSSNPDPEANARLIAAAPKLLTSAQSVLDWVDSLGNGEPFANRLAALRAAVAAVAKATGSQA